MIAGVFSFGDRTVRQVMVPRTDMACLHQDEPLSAALAEVRRHGFWRYPVYREDYDDIVGMVTVKDLLRHVDVQADGRRAADVMRPAWFVPESKQALSLLKEMQAADEQLAVVVDEYGGVCGAGHDGGPAGGDHRRDRGGAAAAGGGAGRDRAGRAANPWTRWPSGCASPSPGAPTTRPWPGTSCTTWAPSRRGRRTGRRRAAPAGGAHGRRTASTWCGRCPTGRTPAGRTGGAGAAAGNPGPRPRPAEPGACRSAKALPALGVAGLSNRPPYLPTGGQRSGRMSVPQPSRGQWCVGGKRHQPAVPPPGRPGPKHLRHQGFHELLGLPLEDPAAGLHEPGGVQQVLPDLLRIHALLEHQGVAEDALARVPADLLRLPLPLLVAAAGGSPGLRGSP